MTSIIKKMMGRSLDEHETLLDLLLFRGIQSIHFFILDNKFKHLKLKLDTSNIRCISVF